jgi:hypothetical protein
MKKIFISFIAIFLNNINTAQNINSVDCIKSEKDSIIIYQLKVKFNSGGEKNKLIELVKVELEKNCQVKPDKIISIKVFHDKRYLTYRYTVLVKKEC